MHRQQQQHRNTHKEDGRGQQQMLTDDVALEPNSVLGRGGFAIVFRGKMRTEHGAKTVAIKRFNLVSQDTELHKKELSVLKKISQLDCKYLVKLYTDINRNGIVHLVLEYCNNGDMMTLLNGYKHGFHFRAIQHFLRQICSALRVLHDHNIMHRDIKPSNLMLHCENPKDKNLSNITVKLCDFGFAGFLSEQQLMHSFCGSPVYMAPEIMLSHDSSLNSGYGPPADLFSLGVTIFQMATNGLPIPEEYLRRDRIQNFHRNFDITKRTGKHHDLDDLLLGLLQREVSKRTTLAEMEQHRFLNEEYPPTAPASPRFTPVQRMEESKTYGWSNNEKKEREKLRKLRTDYSTPSQAERPCEVLYRQVKPGDPFEDISTHSGRLPTAHVPLPRGHTRHRITSSSTSHSSLLGSIVGSVHLLGSFISKPRVRHEVGDSSCFEKLDVTDADDDDFVLISEKKKEKLKPKPEYRYERIATTRSPVEQNRVQQNSRKSALRELKKEEEKIVTPETTTKKLKPFEPFELEPLELPEPLKDELEDPGFGDIADEMFQTAVPADFQDNHHCDGPELSEDLFTSCSDQSVISMNLEERKRTNSAASIDSGISCVSVDSLSVVPYTPITNAEKLEQLIDFICDNKNVKREYFRSISDPYMAQLLRMLTPVMEHQAGLKCTAPYEGDFLVGVQRIVRRMEAISDKGFKTTESDVDTFCNAALLFAQSIQKAGNNPDQWKKLLYMLEIFEKNSTDDQLRHGFRAMSDRISQRKLMLN
uniref:Protein kinase domain-containing protein n=1 Tax=Steinernema glaseri TaxID=37863 RepID=A0A1I8ATG5_9BILA